MDVCVCDVDLLTALSKAEREIHAVNIKIEQEKASKTYLSETIGNKKKQLAQQAEEFARNVQKAEKLVDAAKRIGIQNQGLVDRYEKVNKQYQEAQRAFTLMGKNLNLKAGNKLRQLDFLRKENNDLVSQLNNQTKVIQDQRVFLDTQFQKEDELEMKRHIERQQYTNKLDDLLKKYQNEQTKMRIDALNGAISDLENPTTIGKVISQRQISRTGDFNAIYQHNHDKSDKSIDKSTLR